MPPLLATAGVHHHLIRAGLRTRCGLIVETGEAREIHHFALLIGYGAAAFNPYLVFETFAASTREGMLLDSRGPRCRSAGHQELRQVDRRGPAQDLQQDGDQHAGELSRAQIFEAIGLDRELIDNFFTGTPSRLGGIGLDVDPAGRRWRGTSSAFPEPG